MANSRKIDHNVNVSDQFRRPRVLLADDHAHIRQVLRRLLIADCDVVGAVSDSADLPETIERLQPDVVVIDLNMPSINGFEACRRIRAATPGVKVVILTANDDPEIGKWVTEVGAAAFVAKMSATDDLLPAILHVLLS